MPNQQPVQPTDTTKKNWRFNKAAGFRCLHCGLIRYTGETCPKCGHFFSELVIVDPRDASAEGNREAPKL